MTAGEDRSVTKQLAGKVRASLGGSCRGHSIVLQHSVVTLASGDPMSTAEG